MYDLVEDVLQDGFGLASVLYLVRNAQNISSLTDEILQISVLAFIGQLSKTHLFLRELVIKVEELKRRIRQLFEDRWEYSRSQA